jgi:hypothetical protein
MGDGVDCLRAPFDATILVSESRELEPACTFAHPDLSQALVKSLCELMCRARLIDAEVNRVAQGTSPHIHFRLQSRNGGSEALVTRIAQLSPAKHFSSLCRPL